MGSIRERRAHRPVIYLDIDGVLNPYNAVNPHREFKSYERHHFGEFDVWLTPEIGPMLLALDVEVVWATTWQSQANELIATHVGLPPSLRWLRVFDYLLRDRKSCGKLGAVADDCGDRVVVWIDDDLGSTDKAWAKARKEPTLLIKPRSSTGLRRKDIKKISRWLVDNRTDHPGTNVSDTAAFEPS